jgi:Protein phosphatase 2C
VALSVRAFWLPKEGNALDEYEDAFAIAGHHFAIADGATESSFAGNWAKSLVDGYMPLAPSLQASPSMDFLQEWLEPLQRAWHQQIPWDRLLWFAEQKAREGGFSTLLGLSFTSVGGNDDCMTPTMWNAIAVGDSCMFHVRSDVLLAAFPLCRSGEFNNKPPLLSSYAENNRNVWEKLRFANGDCQPNDLFLLSTDALAHWFLAQHEAGEMPWVTLCNINDQADFEILVGELRHDCVIDNDDTTLLRIRLLVDSPICDGTSTLEKAED